jgi:hypothetical protein
MGGYNWTKLWKKTNLIEFDLSPNQNEFDSIQ